MYFNPKELSGEWVGKTPEVSNLNTMSCCGRKDERQGILEGGMLLEESEKGIWGYLWRKDRDEQKTFCFHNKEVGLDETNSYIHDDSRISNPHCNLRLTALLTFHNPSSHIRMPTGRTANSYLVQVQGKLYTPPLGTYSFLFIYSLIHFKCRLEHIQERKKILIQEYAKSLPNSWGYPCHRMWWWWWWWGKGRTVEFCSHSQKWCFSAKFCGQPDCKHTRVLPEAGVSWSYMPLR